MCVLQCEHRFSAQVLRRQPVTWLIVGVLLGVYALVWTMPPAARISILNRFAVYRTWDYRVVTATLLHTTLSHLLMNLVGIGILGGIVERRLQGLRYGLLTAWVSLAGWVFYLAGTPDKPAVGASGLVLGLAGAAISMQACSLCAGALAGGLIWLAIVMVESPPGSGTIHAAGWVAGCVAVAGETVVNRIRAKVQVV